MRPFVILSFVVLGLVYWQMSGGAEFEPEAWPTEAALTPEAVEVITRSDVASGDVADIASVTPLDSPAEAAPVAASPTEPLSPTEALVAVAPDLASAPPLASVEPPLAEADVISAASASAGGPAWRRVAGDRVNMRDGPGTNFGVVGQLAAGEMAEVVATEGEWVMVRASDGTEGWMATRFLEALSL